jgi:hypothetical protein
MRALLIPAKPMSLFRANFKKRFVSGHDFSRAVNEANDEGFSPCGKTKFLEGDGLQAVLK